MKPIAPSELIINPDGSVYHLNLHPEQVAPTVFLVGDPGRVPRVSGHFDRIEHQVQRREFVTHTGTLAGRPVSVLSTGIGTDNIDIVLNELDALANIDFETRQVKSGLTRLNLIRLGTSGGLAEEVEAGEVVVSAWGIGLDNLMTYYQRTPSEEEEKLSHAFRQFAVTLGAHINPYSAKGNAALLDTFGDFHRGITLTSPGFYGPQGRQLRLPSVFDRGFFERIGQFRFDGCAITNFEMETSAIYALGSMLGHRVLSCNAIIAHRLKKALAVDAKTAIDRMIASVLETLAQSGLPE